MSVFEVLVAMGILGLLMALLVPAVQSARETSRRVQCSNHVRPVQLAFQMFEEAHDIYPVPVYERQDWRSLILPYIEQPQITTDTAGVVTGGPEMVSLYRCPSDTWSDSLKYTWSSYLPNDGHGLSLRDCFFHTKNSEPMRSADVTDGLSMTMALSEKLVRPPVDVENAVPTSDKGVWKHRLYRRTANFVADYDVFADLCQNQSTPPPLAGWTFQAFTCIQTSNRHSCTNGNLNDSRSTEYAAVTATSLHYGGVNVAMADGAVRLFSDAIDRQVWRALGTRNGAEPLANSAF